MSKFLCQARLEIAAEVQTERAEGETGDCSHKGELRTSTERHRLKHIAAKNASDAQASPNDPGWEVTDARDEAQEEGSGEQSEWSTNKRDDRACDGGRDRKTGDGYRSGLEETTAREAAVVSRRFGRGVVTGEPSTEAVIGGSGGTLTLLGPFGHGRA